MEEIQIFKCIKEMNLPNYDENEELIEGAFFTTPIGSEWVKEEYSLMSDVRLERDDRWIEITFENFKNHFVKV